MGNGSTEDGRYADLQIKDQRIREILRARAKGGPPTSSDVFRDLTSAYGHIAEHTKPELLKSIAKKASLRSWNMASQDAEDLAQDVYEKGFMILTAQFSNKLPADSFRFDPDGGLPVWAWIHAIVGGRTGGAAGMLGARLKTFRAEQRRLVALDATADPRGDYEGDEARVSIVESIVDDNAVSPENAAVDKSTLATILRAAELLPERKRLPVTILTLSRMGLLSAEALWRAIDLLIQQLSSKEMRRSMARVVRRYKTKIKTAPLTDAFLFEMLEDLVGRGSRSLERWFAAFIAPFAAEKGIEVQVV